MKISPMIERGSMLILLLYPILLLTVRGGMGLLFFLMLILAVTALVKNGPPVINRADYWFAFAASVMLIATILSQAHHNNFLPRFWDSPSRFLLAVPAYMVFRSLSVRVISILEIGIPVGAMTGLLATAFNQYFHADVLDTRWTVSFMNPIHFGNLALLLGVLSLCSINWIKPDSRYVLTLKLIGFVAGVCASILSGTRGGWVAIPFMLLVWGLFQPRVSRLKLIMWCAVAALIMSFAGYFLVDNVQLRVDETVAEMVSISHGNLDSNFGQRLQLWHAAIIMFMQNPIFGVGPDAFFQTMTRLQQDGILQSVSSSTYGTEVHSYYFAAVAELGLLGLLAGISMLVIPLVLFLKFSKSKDQFVRVAATMGACTVTAFIFFCFTVEMFNLKMIASFYALTVAVLLGAANRQEGNGLADNVCVPGSTKRE